MRSIIVTGATGNLGQAVVKKFLDEGYRVTGTVLPDDITPLDFPTDQFEKAVVDLVNEQESATLVANHISRHGTIDAAILTVGGFTMGGIRETKTGDIFRQYRLNFETAYNMARPLFTQMMKQGNGRIFMIGSRPGMNTANGKGMVAYSLSKSLIFRLAELMNAEAEGKNVLTRVIVPSTIDTPQNRKAMPDADFSKWTKPEAIAGIIYDLCKNPEPVLKDPVVKV